MKKPIKRQDASLSNKNMLIVGASGSGKSSYLREKIDFSQKRIIAWDPDEDFKLPRVRDIATFKKLCKKSGFGAIRVALTVEPTEENFEIWAGLVFAMCHQAAHMTILADEIADVTRVGKASPKWGQLCRKVRKYGGILAACTQRPQEADKTIFNQVKYKWCGALASNAAYKFMAAEFDVPIADFKALENIERVQVQYWIRDGISDALKETMSFNKPKPKPKPKAKKKPVIKKKTAKA